MEYAPDIPISEPIRYEQYQECHAMIGRVSDDVFTHIYYSRMNGEPRADNRGTTFSFGSE